MPGRFRKTPPIMPNISIEELETRAKKQEELFTRASPEAIYITAVNREGTRFQVTKHYMGVKGDSPAENIGIYDSFSAAKEAANTANTENLPIHTQWPEYPGG